MPIPKQYDALIQVPATAAVRERLDEIAERDRKSRAAVARELISEALAYRDMPIRIISGMDPATPDLAALQRLTVLPEHGPLAYEPTRWCGKIFPGRVPGLHDDHVWEAEGGQRYWCSGGNLTSGPEPRDSSAG